MPRNIVFIADCFLKDVLGGGELNNQEFINITIKDFGLTVKEVYSSQVSLRFLKEHESDYFIVGNFCALHENVKSALQMLDYVIYEHDHKYLLSRNPALYPNFKAPTSEIINREFYKNAKAVFCQSSFHKKIVEDNLGLDNIKNCSGNLWPSDVLDLISNLRKVPMTARNTRASITSSHIEHKNTRDAIKFCLAKGHDYELIPQMSYSDFLRKLNSNQMFVFFPKTPETLCRIVVEARMLGVRVITNNILGATKEPWFELQGEDLIKHVRNMRETIPKKILEVFENER